MPGNPSLTTFASLGPPWSLASLDANFTATANLLKSVNNYTIYSADSGGANSYAATFSAPVTFTLASGVAIMFKAANTNTGASTLAVNGGAATPIRNPNGTALLPGQIMAGCVVSVLYDGTNWILVGAALSDGPMNQVMNGPFNFLRDTSVTSHNPTASAVSYLLQRWYNYQVGGVTGDMTVSWLATGPASDGALTNVNKSSYANCVRITRNVAATLTDSRFKTVFPTSVSRQLSGRPLQFTFYARAGAGYSAASLNIVPVVSYGTGSNQSAASQEAGTWTGQTSLYGANLPITTSWQEFTIITSALPASATQIALGFQFAWQGVAAANDYVEIAGVRLAAVGATYAPIVEIPPDEDYMRCLRFFELKSGTSASDASIGSGFFVTTTKAYIHVPFYQKNAIPSFNVSNVGDFYLQNAAANDVATAFSVPANTTTLDGLRLNVDIGTPRTAGQGVLLAANGAAARIYIDADF